MHSSVLFMQSSADIRIKSTMMLRNSTLTEWINYFCVCVNAVNPRFT